MPSFTYHHTRTRSRSRSRDRSSPPPLPRRTSFKRHRLFSPDDEDDDHDDYPYSGAHRPSRALVPHNAPSRLERWNIWTSTPAPERCDSAASDSDQENRRRRARRVSFADRRTLDRHMADRVISDRVNSDEERAFHVRIARLTGRERERERELRCVSPPPPPPPPRRCRAESDDERVTPRVWSAELFRRRERCVSEDFEARRCARSRSRERRCREWVCCSDDDADEEFEGGCEGATVVRWRRVKRTRTSEWRPLAGWRRA